jgi:hypothetical protein
MVLLRRFAKPITIFQLSLETVSPFLFLAIKNITYIPYLSVLLPIVGWFFWSV